MKNNIRSRFNMRASSPGTAKPFLFVHMCITVFVISILLFSSCKNSTEQVPKATANTGLSAATRDSLSACLNTAHGRIDELMSKNVALDTQNIRLDNLLAEKDQKIAALTARVVYLRKSNQSLSGKSKLTEKLETENEGLRQRSDDLLDKYNNLKEIGSVLHASDIRLFAVHLRHHGTREKFTNKADKTDELRVYFDIDKNRIAEDGDKKLYVTITDPDGNLLSDAHCGSGVTKRFDGKPLKFSIIKDVSIKQNEPVDDVSVDWRQENEYKTGRYSVAIYNSGFRIGRGELTLN